MSSVLLDVNVLLALAWPNHQMHAAAVGWFRARDGEWCTCPTTQLAFVRLSSNPSFTTAARPPRDARALLARMLAHQEHRFLTETEPPASEAFGTFLAPLLGPKQVTDAWLLFVARQHACRLATFDRRMESWAPRDSLDLI